MNIFKRITLSALSFLGTTSVYAQQEITVEVSPTTNVSINGHLELDRAKYFNLAANVNEYAGKVEGTEMFDYYFKDLDIKMGRALGMVFAENRWEDNLREDPNRKGFVDIEYFKSQMNPSDKGLEQFKKVYGDRQGLVIHDRAPSYPTFMEQYNKDKEGGHGSFPVNNEAAAEIVANMLKYKFTDFQRPSYYELVNEPDWRFWNEQAFIDFHTMAKQKVDEMNIPTEIGGPCFSVSYYYKKEYANIKQILKFIDATDFSLDFYSFHTYDYMRWDDDKNDFIGSISSGLPLEGVFDALASYTYQKYGKEFTYVSSEHGGYIPNHENRDTSLDKLGEKYFAGSGFEYEMEKRSICNYVMVNSAIANTLTFMNHPHIVKKTVPFILLETSAWDPKYYASLLVKENFDKNSKEFAESDLIHFYKYFADVKGRRVSSFINDNDIQHMSFVDGNKLILLFHNQSNVEGNITLDIKNDKNKIKGMKLRTLRRNEDFRSHFEETEGLYTNKLNIPAQGSLVAFVEYEKKIKAKKEIDEIVHYSADALGSFTGSKVFNISIPEYKKAEYGILRIGMNRKVDFGKEVEIKVNGIALEAPVEDSAERLTDDGEYTTTKIVRIDGKYLKEENKVEVSFPDGNSAGVGAVVIRAGISTKKDKSLAK